MKAYREFAKVYDFLMKDVNYDGWIDFLEKIFAMKKIKPQNILELACGTGNISNRLAAKNYDVTAIDISVEMLAIAEEKGRNLKNRVKYINQDIRNFDVGQTYDCIISMCDGINYIIDDSDLVNLFNRVYNSLNEKGLLIFDISSYYKIKEILGNNTYAENFDEVSYIWENYFDEDTNICEFDLTLFIKTGEYYKKYEETHRQRAYRVDEILRFLDRSGFKLIEIFNDYSFNPIDEFTERISFVCEKNL